MSASDLQTLALFRDLLSREPLRALLGAGGSGERAALDTASGGAFVHALTREPRIWTAPPFRHASNPAEAWLIEAAITSDNLWSRLVERKARPGPLLDELARRDLEILRGVRDAARELLTALVPAWTADRWQAAPADGPGPWDEELAQLVAKFGSARSWAELLPDLAGFIERAGAGLFNAAFGFRWTGDASSPFLPVTALDETRLEHLVGQSEEREKVVRNTERLVQGLPAHNVLLYGDRGTGKSATVKALLHRFGPRGLRLVELPKALIHTLPELVAALSGRGLAFIIFIDDLSFESAETEYKELKAFLEGSLAPPAPNVKVYATSNRRHLVREEFSDRNPSGPLGTADDDVRRQDTVQEKLSLADRFGLTVIFPTPTQEQYLAIVRSLARLHGIDLPDAELRARALRWAAWQNGRSGRTAKQFIDELRGATA